MAATAKSKQPKPLVGAPLPRVAPPRPLKTTAKALLDQASEIGETFLPWQETAAKYIEARSAGGWLYPEVALLVGRQNGKTWILKSHIIRRLLMGRRVVHSAQDRRLPRDVFLEVADEISTRYPELLVAKPRLANGQEEIRLNTGGRYLIVAPNRSAARGIRSDDIVLDEVWDLEQEFYSAIAPTNSSSPDPQTLYVSNAGTPDSEILESLRQRAEAGDPSLAYLEWSAGPDLSPDDRAGWCQANPGIGHIPSKLANIERAFRAAQLGGTLSIFEREYLCRQTVARRELLVQPEEWSGQDFGELPAPVRPVMAIKMDISGERASAVIAWREEDERISLQVVANVTGSPIDADRLGPELMRLAAKFRVGSISFDPYTDADLARYLRQARAMTASEYASASERFVRLVKGRRLRVSDDGGLLADDLAWTIRKTSHNGTYMAVKASDDRTNTAALAAVRAVWLASGPFRPGLARIH